LYHKDTTKTPNTNNMNTISLRLYPETETLYKRLLDECDAGTNGRPATADQFINYLLECAQNPRTKEVSQKTDIDRIKQLEAELETLKAENTALSHANFQDKTEIDTLKDKLANLPPAAQASAPAQLDPDQVTITLFDADVKMLNDFESKLLEKEGKQFARSEIFAVMFNKGHIKKLPLK